MSGPHIECGICIHLCPVVVVDACTSTGLSAGSDEGAAENVKFAGGRRTFSGKNTGDASSYYIGTSNQLGGFESGLVAQLIGPVLAVVTGGIGTILVVLLVAWRWPEMRRLGTLREARSEAQQEIPSEQHLS